jgi:hypothetical protein
MAEPGERPGTDTRQHGGVVASLLLLVGPGEELRGAGRAHHSSQSDERQHRCRAVGKAGAAGVLDAPLARVGRVVHECPPGGDQVGGEPGHGQPEVVLRRLEQRHRLRKEGLERLVRCLWVDEDAPPAPDDSQGESAELVSGRLGRFEKGRAPGERLGHPHAEEERVEQVGLERGRDVLRIAGGDCSIQKGGGGGHVGAEVGLAAGGGQALSGLCGELGLDRPAELAPVQARLFEVVAEDLVLLDEGGAVFREPGGVALVQLGPARLGDGVVGGIADQEVAEAETVFAGDLSLVGADQLAPGQSREVVGDLGVFGGEGFDGFVVEDLALDRGALEDAPLRRLELVETGSEQRSQCRGDVDLGVLRGHGEHLGHEERVAAGGLRDVPPDGLGHAVADQLGDLLLG